MVDDTTTDAAEARENLAERIRAAVTYQYMPMQVRTLLSEAAQALATAEAASGAGEREGIDLLAVIQGVMQDEGKADLKLSGKIYTAVLASLPPATGPGMTLTAEMKRAGAIALAESEGHHPDRDGAYLFWESGAVAAWNAMLAVAPTIPATGEAVPAGMKPWRGGTKPDDWSGEAVMFRDGDIRYAPVGAIWKLGWDHSYGKGDIIAYTPKATIPATGHAATEKTLSDVLDEARKSLRITDGCMECNANDVQRWQDTVAWLESLA